MIDYWQIQQINGLGLKFRMYRIKTLIVFI